MAWQEREYVGRPYGGGWRSVLYTLFRGSVPLGKWFGIRVRVQASLIWLAAWWILLPPGHEFDYFWALKTALVGSAVLFGIVLLHEFGHCVAARAVGGEADQILLWPLGGLASTNPPQRPLATFITVAGGPLVNVLICAAVVVAYFLLGYSPHTLPWHPFHPGLAATSGAPYYLKLVFLVSYALLLFNLLPIYPLDGGQMLQSILWPMAGYVRSMHIACMTGMIGAVLMGTYGLFVWNWMYLFLAVAGFTYCYQRWQMLKEFGPEGMLEGMDYSAIATSADPERHRRKLSKRAIRRIRRRAAAEQAEQERIDQILAKVSAHGMGSLTWWERRTLRKETARQRERDLELTRRNG